MAFAALHQADRLSRAAPRRHVSLSMPPAAREADLDEETDLTASPPPPAAPRRRGASLFGGLTRLLKSARESESSERRPDLTALFSGVPTLTSGEAILFDSARDRGVLPEEVTLARLVVRFPEGSPDPRGLDPGLELRLFVDDPTTPRARVRLADLVRRRGERPLNLRVGPGQAVRIVLADRAGAWARGAPRIEVALGW
jgi:hypothetical protein